MRQVASAFPGLLYLFMYTPTVEVKKQASFRARFDPDIKESASRYGYPNIYEKASPSSYPDIWETASGSGYPDIQEAPSRPQV